MKSKLYPWAFSNLSRMCRFCRLRDVAITSLLLVLFIALLPTSAWPQTLWIKHNNNPVLDAGPSSAWDGGRIFYHFIFFDGAQYRMWYTGYNPTLNARPAIGYAAWTFGQLG